ncbi:Alanine--tRNA ligase (Alanyl-tRNA synthetase) (AlaRS) [Durusdinium trenchii]|uniref:Alanine--tRNA ligase n=1 Tax=Durusdinium trenchii TaxID=1381693 RepID=A0ABP0LK26_9DINO
MTSLKDIRSQFLEFFADRGHTVVPSAPLVPQNDPTLMFVNAGMVPFKNIFTGAETRDYVRAASSQKCVRAGGKHNDLDNVGYTARHHTFFEMLGNFSFGDYFKEEAIDAAWTLVHKNFGLSADRLTVTIYHTDDTAFDLWRKISGLPDERIIRIATNDNFWAMGDTGPCGPCSEIFYDHGEHIPGGPPGSPDEDGDRFVEIWNLVFMQFEKHAGGDQINLPKPSIDTGMGLERIAAVLQGVHDNYDVDLFKTLIDASVELTGRKSEGADAPAHRVIADHLRATSFLIADGVAPSNEGRGYVLRRIMRRAMRYAHGLGARDPLLTRLAPLLVDEMGAAFPELGRAQKLIVETLRSEEEKFRGLLDRGLKLLDAETAKLADDEALPGDAAFKLYDTYGFPLDLTQDALRREGRLVDVAGFDAAMQAQRAAARAAWAGSGDDTADESVWFDLRTEHGATEFLGYIHDEAEGVVQAIMRGGESVDAASVGDRIEITVNQTPFYAEAGGQVGDAGLITSEDGLLIRIEDVKKRAGAVFGHIGVIEKGALTINDNVRLAIDIERRDRIRANHSVTHLAHAALREVLGDHVAQKGSLVAPDRMRFDITNPKPITRSEIAEIERRVNTVIRQNTPVETTIMPYDDAVAAGAIALFGEKYDDDVRVLTMGRALDGGDEPYSVELCGGTHVCRIGDIALFKIISEGAVSAGVRRIEALTGEAARQYLESQSALALAASDILKTAPDELPGRVEALVAERKKLERELSDTKKALALGGGGQSSVDEVRDLAGVKFSGRVLDGVAPKDLRGLVDEAKKKLGVGVAAFIGVNDGKAALAVGVSDALHDRLSAVDLVRVGAAAVGGKGGGGRADMAQAGGPDGAKAEEALEAIAKQIEVAASA